MKIMTGWQEIINKHQSALADELNAQLDSALSSAADKARTELDSALSSAADKARIEKDSALAAAAEKARTEQDSALAAAAVRARTEQDSALAAAAVRARMEQDSAMAAAAVRAHAEQDAAVASASAKARSESARAVSEGLNQALRQLRDARDETDVWQLVASASAPWAKRAVVVEIENHQAKLAAQRLNKEAADENSSTSESSEPLIFDATATGAVRAAIESGDPVAALASPSEIPAELVQTLDASAESKAYLFPVVSRNKVCGILIATGEVAPAPLELLSVAAAMRVEIIRADRKTPRAEELVQIASGAVKAIEGQETGGEKPAERKPLAWTDLSAEDQRLHLRAQRVARVRVAEMRLYNSQALQRGIASRDLYGNLRAPIDEARTDFLRNFLSKSPTMVDYLHLEILRSLAHEDDRLLGDEYPGPMV
jgi:hypothetical protein